MQARARRRRGAALGLSLPEARRLAVAAQGFGRRPARPEAGHLRRLADRVGAFQIDSVNVVARAHYVPAFARLGPYRTEHLDALAYQRRDLFEYWGHAASLMPMSLYPLVRYRMYTELASERMQRPGGEAIAKVYEEVGRRGALAASDLTAPGRRNGKWWGWSEGKQALEFLFGAGLLAISGRRNFERLYDLTERVIPEPVREAPFPEREDAMKALICLGARACGVGTASDIASYLNVDGWRDRIAPEFWRGTEDRPRRVRQIAARLIEELVDEGRLVPAVVEGWIEPAYVVATPRIPREVNARALVTPFDSLVWAAPDGPGGRRRMERLFGMRYTIEIYLPSEKRTYGYYVFPFLLGDTLVARCDLKADRARGVLTVKGAFVEDGQDPRRVATELAAELGLMRDWLGLDRVEVERNGTLAAQLRPAIAPGA